MKTKFICACLYFAAFAVEAHTPYLVPTSFEPVFGDQVTLDASFAEKFFVPEAAFNDSEFFVIGPDGKSIEPDTSIELNTRVVLEHQLVEPGTYRFSTGVRYGAVFRIYEVDGERGSTRDPKEELPEGAVLLNHFQSVTQAQSYVSKEGPTETVFAPTGAGLEIVPLTHPNDLFAGDKFRFRVLFEGKAMSGFGAEFHLGTGQFDGGQKIEVITDENGEGAFVPSKQGVYLMHVRHRADAPEDAPAPRYSHTTTLSIEVY